MVSIGFKACEFSHVVQKFYQGLVEKTASVSFVLTLQLGVPTLYMRFLRRVGEGGIIFAEVARAMQKWMVKTQLAHERECFAHKRHVFTKIALVCRLAIVHVPSHFS